MIIKFRPITNKQFITMALRSIYLIYKTYIHEVNNLVDPTLESISLNFYNERIVSRIFLILLMKCFFSHWERKCSFWGNDIMLAI